MSSPHALLSLSFIASRAALYLAGVRFDFSLDWMWLSDPADLRERLLETLYYFHAFPPGMNLVTGILLKMGGADAATLALAMFWGLGLAFVNALFHLCRVSGVSTPVALGIALAFSLVPQSIYLEHLYLYEYPIATLLCVAAVFFYEAARRRSFWMWLAFFAICTAIGVTRSTFHLVWFAAMVGAGLWLSERAARRRVLGAAAVPAVVLLALYVKNFALFGAFNAFTFGPVSHTLVTTWHLSPEVRDSWIAEGRLSPFAAVSVYAGPREYLSLLGPSVRADGPPQLTRLDRPSVHAGNYNHRLFLEVNRRRGADARAYVQARPLEYAATVLTGLRDMFTPSTVWHPAEPTGRSPHHQHRQVLGSYEASYNRLMYSLPVPPIGLYAFVPFVVVWTLRRARSLLRAGDSQGRALGALLSFCLFQIAFVVTVSSAFTFRESARYRYQVEAMLWLLTAVCVISLWRSWRLAVRGSPVPRRPATRFGGTSATTADDRCRMELSACDLMPRNASRI